MIARLRPLSVLCLAALLTACGPRTPDIGQLPEPSSASVSELLREAGESKPDQALLLRLAAADKALATNDLVQARDILASLKLDGTPPVQRALAATLQAELALARSKPKRALQHLQNQALTQQMAELPVSLQIRSQLALARALQADGQSLAAARERVYLAPSLRDEEATANHEQIWQIVSYLSDSELIQPQSNETLAGWLQLASLVRQNGLPTQQLAVIKQWKDANPLHPAAMQLPEALASLSKIASVQIQHVGLLLPQQGQLATAGQALRDGFLAAHYVQPFNPELKISLYDSSQVSNLSAFYRQAQADGVQMLIGPLEKPLVTQMTGMTSLPLPTLALNYADGKGPAELIQYGLAAEDEAREIARKARAEGRFNAVALVPAGSWGQRVAAAFREAFEADGGLLVGVEYISQPGTLSNQIGELMKLRASEDRAQKVRAALRNENVAARPTRRQDIDMVFLATTAEQARQIKPILSFQYASDLPVYATSHLFTGDIDPVRDFDLSGIRFCETPWMLQTGSLLRSRITGYWPQALGAIGRLYAMGADAYGLIPRSEQLRRIPGSSMQGLTGTLQMGQGQRIVRQLPWAEYREGQVFLLEGQR